MEKLFEEAFKQKLINIKENLEGVTDNIAENLLHGRTPDIWFPVDLNLLDYYLLLVSVAADFDGQYQSQTDPNIELHCNNHLVQEYYLSTTFRVEGPDYNTIFTIGLNHQGELIFNAVNCFESIKNEDEHYLFKADFEGSWVSTINGETLFGNFVDIEHYSEYHPKTTYDEVKNYFKQFNKKQIMVNKLGNCSAEYSVKFKW